MTEVSADELSAPFLTKMLGKIQVLSTDLKCTKQKNGKYLYEYSIQVHPEEEDENLVALLQPKSSISKRSRDQTYDSTYSESTESRPDSSLSYNRSYHSDGNCTYLVNVRFVLFHRNINGRGQSTSRSEFSSDATLREVIEYFRNETTNSHRGNFTPRLAYSIGRDRNNTYPLSDSDLQRPLSDLFGDRAHEVNTLTILADIC